MESYQMSERKTRKRNKVLTSRNYVHLTCCKVTELSGPEFNSVANPLAEMMETHCGHCDVDDSLRDFEWEDTGETLWDYVARHRENIPDEALEKTSHDQVVKYAIRGAVVGGVIGVALGGLVGAVTSLMAGIISGVVLTLIAVPLGAILHFMKFESKIVQPLMEKYLGVTEVGELR